MKKCLSFTLIFAMLLVSLVSCSSQKSNDAEAYGGDAPKEGAAEGYIQQEGWENDSQNGEQESILVENPFISTLEEAVSTFSADVDTASYTYFRKLVSNDSKHQYDLEQLQKMSASFRTEEFLNYFRYEAKLPQNGELFGVTAAIADCPWNGSTKLMRLTLQAEVAVPEGGNNLVFLIDVSGSMSSSDKLPLLKNAFSYLVSQLTEEDRVSIVTYSGKEEVVLSGCPGNEGERILKAIQGLQAKGSTNGEAGLVKAYELAQRNYIEKGNNRIIMASDGDLNVGITDQSELKAFVEGKRDAGIYLSVLGFGTGNYRDSKMETLADNGNGVYYYIDGMYEAEKIFGTDLLSTLYTVAEDVKLQITFDPACVGSYRLIGYENRLLSKEDFEDDTKDAGEVGAGHQVTVFYELSLMPAAGNAERWMTLAVRYKRPGETASQLNEYPIGSGAVCMPDSDFLFQTAVIETAMILHGSKYLNDINLDSVLSVLESIDLSSAPDRSEFRDLVRKIAG